MNGYLNGQLSVSRALGDWHMKGPKGSPCPLSAEPELQEICLTEDDEFLIMGCDGLWDVMSNQCAVTMARKELMILMILKDPPPRIETPPSRVRRSISAEGLNLLRVYWTVSFSSW
ncbi:PPM-type phosphatase domain [Sesbania bispinosa]|nr:PPM-type phosphatase domain [Sesbania bispinosa]